MNISSPRRCLKCHGKTLLAMCTHSAQHIKYVMHGDFTGMPKTDYYVHCSRGISINGNNGRRLCLYGISLSTTHLLPFDVAYIFGFIVDCGLWLFLDNSPFAFLLYSHHYSPFHDVSMRFVNSLNECCWYFSKLALICYWTGIENDRRC